MWKVSLCTVLVGLSLCLLLATAKNNSRGQGAKVACGGVSVPVGMYTVCVCFPVTGAQVPITSYTCTQPTTVSKEQGQCTVSDGLRTCEMKGGANPNLLSSSGILGLYTWDSNRPSNPNPFVVLDILNGWCVGSVEMTFRAPGSIPTLSLSVHSAEHLSTDTDRTIFCKAIDNGGIRTPVVMMNFTTLAHGKYLRINMTSTGRIYLTEIKVFGTSKSVYILTY